MHCVTRDSRSVHAVCTPCSHDARAIFRGSVFAQHGNDGAAGGARTPTGFVGDACHFIRRGFVDDSSTKMFAQRHRVLLVRDTIREVFFDGGTNCIDIQHARAFEYGTHDHRLDQRFGAVEQRAEETLHICDGFRHDRHAMSRECATTGRAQSLGITAQVNEVIELSAQLVSEPTHDVGGTHERERGDLSRRLRGFIRASGVGDGSVERSLEQRMNRARATHRHIYRSICRCAGLCGTHARL